MLGSPKDRDILIRSDELSEGRIRAFMDTRKKHLSKANDLVLKLKNGISNSDAKIILEIMYHKVIANVLLPEKRYGALTFLSSKDNVESDDINVRRRLLQEIDSKLVEISKFPLDPTSADIKSFCKDDAILYWFELAPHCWEDERCFWSVRDVVGTMNGIIKLKENNFVENGKSVTFPDCIAYGEFPIILEQVV